MTVEATDADDPETDNAALRFSILEQGAGGMFSINATTGEICTARPGLDREVGGTGGALRGAPGLEEPWVGPCALPAVVRGGNLIPVAAGGAQSLPLAPHRVWGCTT